MRSPASPPSSNSHSCLPAPARTGPREKGMIRSARSCPDRGCRPSRPADDVEDRMGGLSHAVYLGAFFESHDGGDDGQADTFLVAEQLRHFCLRGLSWRPWI